MASGPGKNTPLANLGINPMSLEKSRFGTAI